MRRRRAASEENSCGRAVFRAEGHLCLDGEAGGFQPGRDLGGLTAVDMDFHRVVAVSLCLQQCAVADMKAEQQRAAGAQCAPELCKDRVNFVIRDVDLPTSATGPPPQARTRSANKARTART
jgi:hypothetical protein